MTKEWLTSFSDDDKLHSKEAGESKEIDEDKNDSTKGREEELAMDPLGNPEITRPNQRKFHLVVLSLIYRCSIASWIWFDCCKSAYFYTIIFLINVIK